MYYTEDKGIRDKTPAFLKDSPPPGWWCITVWVVVHNMWAMVHNMWLMVHNRVVGDTVGRSLKGLLFLFWDINLFDFGNIYSKAAF